MALVGCNGEQKQTEDKYVIRSLAEYQKFNDQARELAKGRLDQAEFGEILPQDKEALREALRLYDAMIAFRPSDIGPYLPAGSIYQVLGQDEQAVQRFSQMVANAPENPPAAIRVSIADAHYLSAKSLVRLQKYEDAVTESNKALQLFADVPNYLTGRASAYIQLGKVTEARQDLERALELEPENKNAHQLLKLVEMAEAES